MAEEFPHLDLSADEVLTTTRSVRKRLDLARPVPLEVIEDALEVAWQVPALVIGAIHVPGGEFPQGNQA